MIKEKQDLACLETEAYEKKLIDFFKDKVVEKVDALSMSYKYQYRLPKKKLPEFLDAVISFSVDSVGNFALSWGLVLGGEDALLHYLFGEDKNKKSYIDLHLGYEALRNGKFITSTEYNWLPNRLNISWHIKDIDRFFSILDDFDTKMQDRYKYMENIIKDRGERKKIFYKLLQESGRADFIKNEVASLENVAIYKMFDHKKEAIIELEKYIDSLPKNDKKGYAYDRLNAYLDHLKNGTPLPYIPSPHDKASVLSFDGEDIYILLNKKIPSTKDKELLAYFGDTEQITLVGKADCDTHVDPKQILICRVGKWTMLKLGFEFIKDLSPLQIENLLKELSEKYNRAILAVNQDTSATFGFEIYKKGEFLRRWMVGDGEVLENLGKPVTGEKKRFADTLKKDQDSDSVIEFLDGVLKITHADLEKSKANLYAMT